MFRFPLVLSLLFATPSLAADKLALSSSDIDSYSSEDQVTSLNQFVDIYPSDWAYQSL